jgi:hypothetical protein
MALGNYPGFQTASSSRTALAVTVYWPTLVSSDQIDERVIVDEQEIPVAQATPAEGFEPPPPPDPPPGETPGGPTRDAPLGSVVGARSGDKGGNANVGFWAHSPEAYLWMADFLTSDCLRELYPEARDLEIERFELPNILSLNSRSSASSSPTSCRSTSWCTACSEKECPPRYAPILRPRCSAKRSAPAWSRFQKSFWRPPSRPAARGRG